MSKGMLVIATSLALLGYLSSTSAVSKVSPQTVAKVGSKTFYISPESFGENGDGRTWADALAYCQRAGKVIASIDTKEEQEKVTAFLKTEAEGGRVYDVWTAGTDYFTEGKWYWISTKRPVDFSVNKDSNTVTENTWYNCLYLGPGGNLQSNYCAIAHARALCQ